MSASSSDPRQEEDGGGMVTRADVERNAARETEAPSLLSQWVTTTMAHPFNDVKQ